MPETPDVDPIAPGTKGTVICGAVSVGLHPDRGVLLELERDDFGFSADEARQLARALMHYADELDSKA